jgi:hypothetical protein
MDSVATAIQDRCLPEMTDTKLGIIGLYAPGPDIWESPCSSAWKPDHQFAMVAKRVAREASTHIADDDNPVGVVFTRSVV